MAGIESRRLIGEKSDSPDMIKRIPHRMEPDFSSECKRTRHSLGILHANLE